MFGGADPSIPALVPADIEISGNHLAKPLRWRPGLPEFEGARWSVKNLLELKNARRVIIDGNLFEHNWPDSQNGFAILFTVRNQDGGAPWSVVEDVVFANNVVRRVGSGINILGHDDNHTSQQTSRISDPQQPVRGRRRDLGIGATLSTARSDEGHHHRSQHRASERYAAHGRWRPAYGIRLREQHRAAQRLRHPWHWNRKRHSGTREVLSTLRGPAQSAGRRRRDKYPGDNFFPKRLSDVGVVNLSGEAYRVSVAAPYAGTATDGRDPGADLSSLAQVISRAASAPWHVQETAGRSVTGADIRFQITTVGANARSPAGALDRAAHPGLRLRRLPAPGVVVGDAADRHGMLGHPCSHA